MKRRRTRLTVENQFLQVMEIVQIFNVLYEIEGEVGLFQVAWRPEVE